MDTTNLLVAQQDYRYELKGTFQDSLRQVNRKVAGQFQGSNAPWSPSFFTDVTWSVKGKNVAASSPLPIIHSVNGKKWGSTPNFFAYGQGTLAQQGTLKLDSDGEYYVEFDGVDDNYAGITNTGGWTQDALTLPAGLTTSVSGSGDFSSGLSSANWLGNLTVFVVLAIRSSVTAGHIWGRTNTAIGAGRIAIASSGGLKFRTSQVFSSGTKTTTGGTTIPVSTRTILTARLTSSTTTGTRQDIYVNGTLDGSLVTGNAITSSASRSDLGGLGPEGTLPMNYYAMIFYPYALDDDSITRINRYFGKRYGITVP